MPTAAPEIRGLMPDDHAGWLPLWQGYLTFYETELAPAVTAATWRRLLDAAEPIHGAVALAPEDGRPIGLVHWVMHRSSWSETHYCYLEDLFVTPAGRRHGLGEALIEHVAEAARRARCSQLYWLTHEANATARSLYDRVAGRTGFIHYAKPLG